MEKTKILDDIRRVAGSLKRAPTRDEYTGRGKHPKLGIASERAIKESFGTFNNALKEAGLIHEAKMSVAQDAGYRAAKLQSEVEGLRQYVRELEAESINAKKIRDIIGAVDTQALGERTGWLRGARHIKSSTTGVPTLVLSDIHFDEVVKSEQVNYVNEYNHEIAVKRLRHTFQTAVDLTKRHMVKPKYDGFVLALGGDMLSGNIHEELAETNEQSINKSLIDLTDILIAGIEGLHTEFGRVFVPCVVGNHGRHHRKPRAKNKVYDNYEWLIYQYLARHFKNKSGVQFLIPDGPDAFYPIYGKNYCLTHGDQFSGGAGISGIFTPLMLGMARKQKKQNAIGQPFDQMICGHFHQYIHTDMLLVNGSVKGYDEYANQLNFPFEPPMQACFIDHPEKRTTFRMPILCDNSKSSRKPPAFKVNF